VYGNKEYIVKQIVTTMGQQDKNVTDETLAKKAARGDRAAFDQIVRRYTRLLIQFVVPRTACYQDAEDIVQETFLRSFVNIGSFDGRFSFKNWLYTIAYRVTVSKFRKKQPVTMSQETIQRMTGDEPAESRPETGGIWDLVRGLKPDDYSILWLRYKQEMDIEQIAAIIGKSCNGVRVHLHRARNRLAKKIAQKNQFSDAHATEINQA
jgi:RNA polymerase sigma-70 factor, ECF subfamily